MTTSPRDQPAALDAPVALDPARTYVHLGEGPDLTLVPVTDDFWSTIDARPELHRGRLLTVFEQDSDWTVWERHPAADEVVMVLSGRCTAHLDLGAEGRADERQVELVAGDYVVVPSGVWHTLDVHEPGRLLVVTWGEGTTHRERLR